LIRLGSTHDDPILYGKIKNFFFPIIYEFNGDYIVKSNTLFPPPSLEFRHINDDWYKRVCTDDLDLIVEMNAAKKEIQILYAKEIELPVDCMCKTQFAIDQFDSGIQFENFMSFINDMVKTCSLERTSRNRTEANFICSKCSRKWTLKKPQFPYLGGWY
jgi:hypothetical protein